MLLLDVRREENCWFFSNPGSQTVLCHQLNREEGHERKDSFLNPGFEERPGLQQALVPESSGRSKEGWVVKAGDPGPTALSVDMPSGRPRDHLQTPRADWD